MIVCICANVNSKAIQAAIDDGCSSLDSLTFETGACSGCGQCRESCQALLDASPVPSKLLASAGSLVSLTSASALKPAYS